MWLAFNLDQYNIDLTLLKFSKLTKKESQATL